MWENGGTGVPMGMGGMSHWVPLGLGRWRVPGCQCSWGTGWGVPMSTGAWVLLLPWTVRVALSSACPPGALARHTYTPCAPHASSGILRGHSRGVRPHGGSRCGGDPTAPSPTPYRSTPSRTLWVGGSSPPSFSHSRCALGSPETVQANSAVPPTPLTRLPGVTRTVKGPLPASPLSPASPGRDAKP